MQDLFHVQLELPQDPEVLSELTGKLAKALRLPAARAEALLAADTLVLDEHEARAIVSVCRSLRIPVEIRRQRGHGFPLKRRIYSQRGRVLMFSLAATALVFAIVAFTLFDAGDLTSFLNNKAGVRGPLVEITAESAQDAASRAAGEAPSSDANIFTAAWEYDLAGVQRVLEMGANVNSRDNFGQTPLMYAAGNNGLGVVRALLEAGAEVNAQSESGRSALMYAVQNNPDPEVVNLLLDAGADINLETDEDDTVIDIAYRQGGAYSELFNNMLFRAARGAGGHTLRKLLAAGAPVDIRDSYGQTPLMYAAQNSAEAVRTLLAAGADVNATSQAGWTALMYAARENSNPAVAQALIDSGADIGLRNSSNQTARDIARESGNNAVLQVIDRALTPVATAPPGRDESDRAQARQHASSTNQARAFERTDSRSVIRSCLRDWEDCGTR